MNTNSPENCSPAFAREPVGAEWLAVANIRNGYAEQTKIDHDPPPSEVRGKSP
jgi:hypothetical protein